MRVLGTIVLIAFILGALLVLGVELKACQAIF